jgi:hypothetical protein
MFINCFRADKKFFSISVLFIPFEIIQSIFTSREVRLLKIGIQILNKKISAKIRRLIVYIEMIYIAANNNNVIHAHFCNYPSPQ